MNAPGSAEDRNDSRSGSLPAHPGTPPLYLSQRQQVIGALAGGIAHDFNNILTAIICQIDLALLDPGLAPGTREALLQALKSGRRGAELNAKLLEFSRHTEAAPTTIDLTRLIDETVFLLRRTIDPRIEIQFPPPAGPAWPVQVDQGQFIQVLMNLALNGRDAIPKTGVLAFEIGNRVFTPEQSAPPRRAGEFVQVTVRDTGHGMPAEVLARLFEPYFTTREFGKGAGLGLCIANHVVVNHGGWIEAESEPGRGSRFHVFLPRAVAPTAPSMPESPPQPGIGAALEGYETVLVVDDEQTVREVIRAMLTFRGYQVVEAADGAEAVERFRAAAQDIDVVLLDLQMPNMNGWDAMRHIRRINDRVPVLVLSGGVSDPPDEGESLPAAAGILRKPFASAELLRAIRKALDAV